MVQNARENSPKEPLNITSHPDWIYERITEPVETMTMVVCGDRVSQSIEELMQIVGLPVSVNYFTKAGCLEMIPFCPQSVGLVVSAGNVVEVAKQFPDRRLNLYIGKPNEIDKEFGYISVITPDQLGELLDQIPGQGLNMITDVTFDGKLPEEIGTELFEDYLRLISFKLPLAVNNFRAGPILRRFDQRHGHDPSLTLDEAMQFFQLRPPLYNGGISIYLGNPFTKEVAEAVAEYFKLPPLGVNQKPVPIDENAERAYGQKWPKDFPKKIFLGGFGGYGDSVPFDELRKLIQRILAYSPHTEITLDLGTYLVEQSCVLLCPPSDTLEKISSQLPDVKQGMSKLISVPLKNIGIAVLRPVSYAKSQLGLPVQVV